MITSGIRRRPDPGIPHKGDLPQLPAKEMTLKTGNSCAIFPIVGAITRRTLMLNELTARTYQDKESRRWFSDDYFDLIVWIENDSVKGFQLCYDKRGNERAVTWFADRGFSHERIDDGEGSPEKNQSPILVPDGKCPVAVIADSFMKRSVGIDPAVRSFVLEKIENFAVGLND